jgi:hypothetical protein
MYQSYQKQQALNPPQAWYDRATKRRLQFVAIVTELDPQGKPNFVYITDTGERYTGTRLQMIIPDISRP